jgi:hypothetical protein
LATFFGRGVEIRRARGALSAIGSEEFSGEVVVLSLILLKEKSPRERWASRRFKYVIRLKSCKTEIVMRYQRTAVTPDY